MAESRPVQTRVSWSGSSGGTISAAAYAGRDCRYWQHIVVLGSDDDDEPTTIVESSP